MNALRAVLIAVACLLGIASPARAVVAGSPANPEAWPWVVALLDPAEADPFQAQFCGGTLVHRQWVLTAAHCVEDRGRFLRAGEVEVGVGRSVLSAITPADRIPVVAVWPYPGRRPSGPAARAYDLAMLRLARPVAITPPALGRQWGEDYLPRTAWVAGWGETGAGYLDELLTGEVTTHPPIACRRFGGTPFGTFCAGLPYEPGACLGDSGGPLMSSGVIQELLGVVSYGPVPCAGYAVYTYVADYRSWITQVIRGMNPRVGLPEIRATSARQVRGGAVEVASRWCQRGAKGHRVVAEFTLAYGRGYGTMRTAKLYGIAGPGCMLARTRIPRKRLPAGSWRLIAKVHDRTSGLTGDRRDAVVVWVR